MKKRIRKVVNFFAFNLLFFALYLNFIHKDNANDVVNAGNAAPAYTGTVLVQNPEQYLTDKATPEVTKEENNKTAENK